MPSVGGSWRGGCGRRLVSRDGAVSGSDGNLRRRLVRNGGGMRKGVSVKFGCSPLQKKKKKEQKECATPQGLLQPIAPVWSARSDVSHAEVVGVFIAGKNLFALRADKGIRYRDRRRRTISRASSPRRPAAHPPSHQLELRRCPCKPATPCTSESYLIWLSDIVSGRPISTRIAWGVGIFHMRGVVSCTAVVAGEAEQKGRPGASSPRCWNGGHVREPRPKMSSHLTDRLGAGCSASHHLL